jgi:hypothetical protein
MPELMVPDFLVIGAARSGTTWIDRQLRAQPFIWMPPKKEIHYFDRSLRYSSPSFLNDDQVWKRWFSLKRHNRLYQKKAISFMGAALLKRKFSAIPWGFDYYFRSIDPDWYPRLFKSAGDKIKGEVTPAYAMLDEVDVRKVHAIAPNAQIIFIIRNPVERSWSQIRRRVVEVGDVSMDLESIRTWLRSDDMRERNDYVRTYEIWTSVYPKSQFHVLFFDELTLNPSALLGTLIKNIAGAGAVSLTNYSLLEKTVNKAEVLGDHAELIELIKVELAYEMSQISKVFGSYSNQWT